MINLQMRLYEYFTIGDADEYGQATIPAADAKPVGKIKMAINIASQSIQDNINYQDCNYTGLTMAAITDKYIIQFGDERLKVLYVNPIGRLKQVFLKAL